MMRILIVHNEYQQRGGEDSVVENEAILLKKNGHHVEIYLRHNNDVVGQGKLSLLKQTIYSKKTFADTIKKINEFKPDVIHVHNSFPLVSPSIYWAAHSLKIPVVQTLHNFRILCPQASFLRNSRVCEDCIGHLPWRGILHRCYRNSLSQTTALVSMLATHRVLGTYREKIDRYIVLNEFCKNKYIQGGLAASKIRIKPNFVEDADYQVENRNGFLFVGRLTVEKGVRVLADAFHVTEHGVLNILGSGEQSTYLSTFEAINLIGSLAQTQVRAYMQSSIALVLPSICYENMPMTLIEAYSSGLPVIASRLGPLCDLIEDGKTGLLFNVGDAEDLSIKMAWANAHPVEMAQMGRNARLKYLAEYTANKNYEILIEIYNEAIQACQL